MIEITDKGTYTVIPGETYVISASLEKSIEFEYDGSSPAPVAFNIVINDSNPEKFDIVTGADLQPTLTIADGVSAERLTFDSRESAETSIEIGDDVSLNSIKTSEDFASNVTIGDNFFLDSTFRLGGADDTITVGENAVFDSAITMDDGNNVFRAGNNLTLKSLNGGDDTDTITLGTLTPQENDPGIDLEGGDDTISVDMSNADAHAVTEGGLDIDGGTGTDRVHIHGLDNTDAQELLNAVASAGNMTANDNGTPTDFTDDTLTGSLDFVHHDVQGMKFDIELNDIEEFSTAPICFTRGTCILTQGASVRVEDLAVGDLVLTMDNGFQPIRWIGSRKLSAEALRANAKLRPVRISAGAMGQNMPERDLLVSRQHRMLVKSRISERMFESSEVLIPAVKLCAMPGIYVDDEMDEVEYFHVLFDDHQVIYANCSPSESLFTGTEALKSLTPEAREEITTLFPEICAPDFVPTTAREIPSGKRQKKLLERHLKSAKHQLIA